MAENPLYLLADSEKYRNAKIDLLSAQSSILLSRERIKKIIELRHSEKIYKTKIVNATIQLKLVLKKLEEKLPKTKGRNNKPVAHHKSSGKRKIVRHETTANPIKDELDIINEKLRELGA